MKKSWIFALLYAIGLLFSMATAATATDINGSIEYRNTLMDGNSSQQLNFYGSSIATGKSLGISGVASVSEGYAEAYLGPIWTPAPWISLEAGIGIQQVESGSPLRFAGAIWIGNPIGSLYYTREQGASSADWWEKFRVFANLGKFAKAGAVYERGRDWGPVLEIPIPSTPFMIRGVWYPKPNTTQLSLFLCF